MPTCKNVYHILGIGPGASTDDIRKAYRKKALETHPDKLEPGANQEDKQEAQAQFHEIHEAFEILRDSVKRKAYDLRLKNGNEPSSISEDGARRIRERKEWAERQREIAQKRMVEFNARTDKFKRTHKERQTKAEIFAILLEEMYRSNPEFVLRREAALKRKGMQDNKETCKPTHCLIAQGNAR